MDSTDGRIVRAPARRKRNDEQLVDRTLEFLSRPPRLQCLTVAVEASSSALPPTAKSCRRQQANPWDNVL
ncbi:unnamed protein product [Ceratitis capitata]|uniref:(Mediterranean fruit fly) hypothetical protein n=1 Tax=Ceratitis capitata TaxID=7213 RepID=A0A811UJC5_CERCA|nr:unnamed protein product [Ceratitis capitata]